MDRQDTTHTEAVKHIIGTIFYAQRALQTLAPEYKWRGMGNLLGDYGEFVAVNYYNLIKSPVGSDGYDAKTKDGKSVQIKTNHAANQIGYRGNADLMLVIHVKDDGGWEEVYFGDFVTVKNESRYSSRDNKYMIAISKLKQMKQNKIQSKNS